MLPIEGESPQSERVWFGNPPRVPHPTIEGCFLHLGSTVNHSVTFLGFRDNTKPGGINCIGTGFFLFHEVYGYLVTVRHVARKLEQVPFVIRATKLDEEAELLDFDEVKWSYHPDPLVDLACFPIKLTKARGFRNEYLTSDMLLTDKIANEHGVDVGDFCYTVGLFHPVYGSKKNMPVVYSGSLSLKPPPGERIPVWDDDTKTRQLVEAYLVESRAIEGASGSPVFVRPVVGLDNLPGDKGETFNLLACNGRAYQLGVFQGAWKGEPDPVSQRRGIMVPVGIGVVIPGSKVLELMEVPELVEHRKTIPPATAARNFSLDDVADKAEPTQPEQEHKAAFNSLVSAAAKKKKQDD